MSIDFQPDTVLPKDPVGFGQWRNGHYREHLQLRQICFTLSPPVDIPDYDILSWRDEPQFVQEWLVSHEALHVQLRAVCNVTGTDLSLVDFSDDEQWFEWMDAHALEHQIFRNVLRVS